MMIGMDFVIREHYIKENMDYSWRDGDLKVKAISEPYVCTYQTTARYRTDSNQNIGTPSRTMILVSSDLFIKGFIEVSIDALEIEKPQ